MNPSSEYTFPIFISSTDYNLIDFRAELASFLEELGYKPILSSAEGFPDKSPTLEPWESCLPVLETAFVMVLVVDKKYGTSLKWPNYLEIIDKEVSPTHGEYLYAQKKKKRMFVFIRRELMVHYQYYRKILKDNNFDVKKTKKILTPILPNNVDFKTLEFISEIKTSKNITWINEFDDVTTVKKEIQKKMLNELAQIFLVKDLHIKTIIESFNKVLASSSPEEKLKILKEIEGTSDLLNALPKIGQLNKELNSAQNRLKKTTKGNKRDKAKYEKEIKSLKKQITELEQKTNESSNSNFYLAADGNIILGKPDFSSLGWSDSNIYSSYMNSGSVILNPSGSPIMNADGVIWTTPPTFKAEIENPDTSKENK